MANLKYTSIRIIGIVLLFTCFFNANILNASENHRFQCGQTISESDVLKYRTQPAHTFKIQYYSKENSSVMINGVEYNQILYLYWKGQYFGYIVYLNEQSKTFNVKKYLFENIGAPFKVEDGSTKYTWTTDKEIIIFRKFSYHQGQAIYLCRKFYMENVDKYREGYNPIIGNLPK